MSSAAKGSNVGCFGRTGLDEDLQVGLRLRHVGCSGGGGISIGMIFVFVWI